MNREPGPEQRLVVAVTGASQDRVALRFHDIGLRVTEGASGERGFQVLVGGDERVGYGEVYNAMVLLQKAGVSKVGLMSDPLDSLEGQGGG